MAIVRKAGRHLLTTRSVHLDIHPRPANLSESREVFRVLQGFGEVDVYKTLRHERPVGAPNSAFAIYRDPEAAQKALSASPIRFALETVVESEAREDAVWTSSEKVEDEGNMTQNAPVKDGVEEITRPSLLLNQIPEQRQVKFGHIPLEHTSSEAAEEAQEQNQAPEKAALKVVRWFHVNVDRTRAVYQDYVERQPFYSDFSVAKSMMQEDLAKRVPHVGLSDVTIRDGNFHRTPIKILQRRIKEISKIKTLRQLWDEVHEGEETDNVVNTSRERVQEEGTNVHGGRANAWGAQTGHTEQWGIQTSPK
ncbi:uncharacterized protein BDZ99DRAFT_246898 [Mytilinidion resinicola]|uniref:RRM domain-containing protein n=1 Tax=Mytilinidion resinicola TaxID=574789 RepID=A0A6A6YW21_9PEZI|nr:uncharacterized protein BDZ99DRAFT_246898 [Mytilinidion resinicola]KAF2812970.1 hypothetical protein BDZ99DRAFT_246898 [Mytilinidion resinicola]